jgi:hypothetical protein
MAAPAASASVLASAKLYMEGPNTTGVPVGTRFDQILSAERKERAADDRDVRGRVSRTSSRPSCRRGKSDPAAAGFSAAATLRGRSEKCRDCVEALRVARHEQARARWTCSPRAHPSSSFSPLTRAREHYHGRPSAARHARPASACAASGVHVELQISRTPETGFARAPRDVPHRLRFAHTRLRGLRTQGA